VTVAVPAWARAAFRRGLEPEPELLVSEWADMHRVLTGRSSAEPGPWRTARFPFAREPMDALSVYCPVQRVVFMGGRQIAKTEIGLNWVGYVIHHAPGPMLYVEPSGDMAKKTSRQRIAPMVEETPALRNRMVKATSRSPGNNMFVREFPGGILMLTGSNSSAALRSTPIRYLYANEVDEYPDAVETKGSALSIAEACTNNFPNRKIFINGNPGVRGASRIEREYLRGDQRRYYIPCPHCGHMDYLTWSGYRDFVTQTDAGHHRIHWAEGEPRGAHMLCGACGGAAPEHAKERLFAAGEWRPTVVPADASTRSYHLSSLYSPFGFKSWGDCAVEFLARKDDPSELRGFVNEVLGETWEERMEKLDHEALAERLERYPAQVPEGVGVLVAAVDVQGDRLEAVVKGYGAGEESWLIEWEVFLGDPAGEEVWQAADRYLVGAFAHQSGMPLYVECVTVDSGGHHTDEVYRYCKVRTRRRPAPGWSQQVYAVKGGTEIKQPLVGRPSRHNRYRTPLYVLCTDTGKGTVQARLRMPAPGPGYVHLPAGLDPEYCAQLAAEKAIWRYSKGHKGRVWQKVRDRNEAFDLEVYALAALKIMGEPFIRELGARAQRWAAWRQPTGEREAPQGNVPMPRRRPARGWVDAWRR
jgi:phage terminase large subunit GpA-like protein